MGDVFERLSQLTIAEQNGDIDVALDGVVWVWTNAVDDEWGALRETVLVGVMQRLAAASPKARTTVAALREQSAPGSNDWLLLCRALGEEDGTLVWLDDARASGAKVPLTDELAMLLHRHGRWKDYGELVGDPLEMLARFFPEPPGDLDEMGARAFAEYRAAASLVARTGVSNLVRGLRAAGRTAEAERVTREALSRDGSAEMQQALNEAT